MSKTNQIINQIHKMSTQVLSKPSLLETSKMFEELKLRKGSNQERLYYSSIIHDGVVATEDIPKGTVIYEGTPILSFKAPKDNSTFAILCSLNLLSTETINQLILEASKIFPITYDQFCEKCQNLGIPDDNIGMMFQQPEHLLVSKIMFSGFFQQNGLCGLYYMASKLNHSCYPNCSWVSNDDHLTMKTIRDVKKGEELTHCYYPECLIKDSIIERQKIINESGRGNFQCECTLCKEIEKRPKNFHFATIINKACYSCGKREINPKTCTGCKTAIFCNKECLAKHWKNGHKSVCKKQKPEICLCYTCILVPYIISTFGESSMSEFKRVGIQVHQQGDELTVIKSPDCLWKGNGELSMEI